MKNKPRFVIAPKLGDEHNLVKAIPLSGLSKVTAEAVMDGRAVYVAPSGMRAKLIPA